MRGKEHHSPKCVVRPPSSLFTFLATTQQPIETLVRDPRVVSLHVSAGYFPTTARRAQYPRPPSWGPKRLCKQTLNQNFEEWILKFWFDRRIIELPMQAAYQRMKYCSHWKFSFINRQKINHAWNSSRTQLYWLRHQTSGGTSLSGKRHFARLLRIIKSCA